MELRKVQKTGSCSLSLTLLKQWTQNQGMTSGDTLLCSQEADGSMRLIPDKLARELVRRNDSPYVIDADHYLEPNLLERIVISSYISGHNHILIRSERRLAHHQLAEIRSAVNQLMGMGVMEETSQQVTLQVALDQNQFTVQTLLKRFYGLIASMLNDAMDSLRNLDREAALNVIQRENEADRLYWLISRLIHAAQSLPGTAETVKFNVAVEQMGIRSVAQDISSIGDHAEAIATEVSRMREQGYTPPQGQIYKKLREVHTETENILREAMMALQSRDMVMVNTALTRQLKAQVTESELRLQLRELTHSKDASSLQIVATHLRDITSRASSIATAALDRCLENSA